MQKIVVGYDGSEHADRALDRAVQIAKADGGEVVVVSAVHLATLAQDPTLGTHAVDPVEAEWARENLEKARARSADAGVALRLAEGHGDPADSVVSKAKEEDADLIVIGTRGLNAAQRALLGSVSTKVVHHAPCDVLVVR